MKNKFLIIYIAIAIIALILFGVFVASVITSDLPLWVKILLLRK